MTPSIQDISHQQYRIEQFLYAVAAACDIQDWDQYLSFFSEDSVLHIPQWETEHQHTNDPKREMSLMYYPTRGGLEDRIFRIRTGKSAACTPMPRTLHSINNVRPSLRSDGLIAVHVNWMTHYYRFGEANLFFGTAHYHLDQKENDFKIKYKQTILLNDKIDSVLDFYHV